MELREVNKKQVAVFTDTMEEEPWQQMKSAMEQDYAVQGAIMPDVHLGYSLPIGGVVATKDIIVPSWVGFDIGCGMGAVKLSIKREQLLPHVEKIYHSICRSIPTGFNQNQEPVNWDYYHLEMTDKLKEFFEKDNKGLRSCGTLGSGNHFIEISYDENDDVWIVVHSGSRGIGHATASHYMKLASGTDKAKEGHFGLKTDSDEGKSYIMDLAFCLEFALANRAEILIRITKDIRYYTKYYEGKWDLMINRNHNHAELKDGLWIHRKGATHAENDMKGIIPGNMRDGSFVVEGKGNPDSLYSSSHGAGRMLGRKQAKRELNLDSFIESMKGITSTACEETLDEAPDAYKNIFEVMDMQKDLVTVMHHLKPIINVKDKSSGRRKRR